MASNSSRGLPPRIFIPILLAFAAVFLGTMAYFLRIGLGETGTALGGVVHEQGDARIAATPAASATDEPGIVTIPQSGTGPGGAAEAAGAAAPPAAAGGGPPAPVAAMLGELRARLARNPSDLAALVALANLYFDAGKFDKALPYYRRALAVDPKNPDTRTDYATALHASGHDLQALAEIDTVLREKPHFPQALFNQGIIAQAIGRRTDAVAAFKAFLQASPDDKHAGDARNALKELGAS